jgi:hypothetical protein
MKHFNNLTPAEAERLSFLAEEMGEAIQSIGKILRHGYRNSNHENKGDTNRELLSKELGHVDAGIYLLCRNGDQYAPTITKYRKQKLKELPKWLHHIEKI